MERVDPEAVEAARRVYRCFEPYGEDTRAVAFVPTSCEDEVVALLAELRVRLPRYRNDPVITGVRGARKPAGVVGKLGASGA